MYPRLYIHFLYHFNIDRDYYECHEVMEELWLEEGRNVFYQGLLQIAVGLHHFRNGNVPGSIKLFSLGIAKLGRYEDELMGINVKKIRVESITYVEKLREFDSNPFPFYDLTIEIIDTELARIVNEIN